MNQEHLEKEPVIEASCCHQKAVPRSEEALRNLKNRLSRMSGQLNGILIQVSAVENALQAFGYLILQEHMETCMVEEIRKGNLDIVEEAFELMKKLK